MFLMFGWKPGFSRGMCKSAVLATADKLASAKRVCDDDSTKECRPRLAARYSPASSQSRKKTPFEIGAERVAIVEVGGAETGSGSISSGESSPAAFQAAGLKTAADQNVRSA